MSDSGELPEGVDIAYIDAAIMQLLFPETQQTQDVLMPASPPANRGQHQPGTSEGLRAIYRAPCHEEGNSYRQPPRPKPQFHQQAPSTPHLTVPPSRSAVANPPQNMHQVDNRTVALLSLNSARSGEQERRMLEADNALALRRLKDAREELSEHPPPHPPAPLYPFSLTI